MRTTSLAVTVLLAAASGCDARPATIVICHNANCAHATDPFKDDTLAALDDSLALEYLGRPAWDGVELDTYWDAAWNAESGRCLFAHDLETAPDDAPDARAAADRVAAHLRKPADHVSWEGDRLYVKIELKSTVTVEGAEHTPADQEAHYACVFDMTDAMLAAARESGWQIEIIYESESVPLLRGLTGHVRWPGKDPDAATRLRLATTIFNDGLSTYDLESLAGGDRADGMDILSFHSTRYPDGMQQSYQDLGVELQMWMLDAALETLYAIQVYQPRYTTTSEALLLRRWLEY